MIMLHLSENIITALKTLTEKPEALKELEKRHQQIIISRLL